MIKIRPGPPCQQHGVGVGHIQRPCYFLIRTNTKDGVGRSITAHAI